MNRDLVVEEGQKGGARFVLLLPPGRSDEAAMLLSGEIPLAGPAGGR